MDNSCKKRLIKALQQKHQIIEDITGITSFYIKQDYEEIQSWNAFTCERIVKRMVDYLLGDQNVDILECDYATCPWCILYLEINDLSSCQKCTYGQRHGLCILSEDSLYKRVIRQLSKVNPCKGKVTIHKIEYMTDILYELLIDTELS